MKTLVFLLTLAGHASAAVIYSGIQNIPIPTTQDGIYVNLDTGANSDSPIVGWDINPFFGGYAFANSDSFQPVRTGTSNMDSIAAMVADATNDMSLAYATGFGGSSDHMSTVGGGFAPGAEQYIGFRFIPDGGTQELYGWLLVTFTVNQPGGLIESWAWEDSGGPIQIGSVTAVPEPGGSLMLSALVGAGCCLRLGIRRRPVSNDG